MAPCVLEDRATDDHRMVECSEGHGCRLEIPHAGEWGTITNPKDNRVGELACEQFGLRGRPEDCGPEAATLCVDGDRKGALTHPTPAAPDVKIWMGSVKCNTPQPGLPSPTTKIHECSARDMGGGVWGAAFEGSHDGNDVGICCWV